MPNLVTNTDAQALFQEAVRFLVESLGAEGGLAMYGRRRLEVRAAHNLDRNNLRGEALLNQVYSEGAPLLGRNNSVLCVPIFRPDLRGVAGVLYAERPDPKRPFTQEHFKRLVGFTRSLQKCLFSPAKNEVAASAFQLAKKCAPEPVLPPKKEKASRPEQESLRPVLHRRPQYRSLSVFFRSLATMLEAGINVDWAIGMLNNSGDPALDRACEQIERDLLSGHPLWRALHNTRVFSGFQVQLVRTGERSGRLPAVVHLLAQHQEKTEATLMKVRSSLTYPLIIFVLAFAGLILAPPFLLKGQLEMLENSGAELPFITDCLIFISALAASPFFWSALGCLVLLSTLVATKTYQTPGGRRLIQGFLYELPLVGPVARIFVTSRFARALSIQLKTGILWTEALPQAAAASGSAVLAEKVSESVRVLKSGETPSESLRQANFFPDLLLELVQVGQETGTPATLVEWVAELYDSELESAIDRSVAMIEPLVMAGMGLLVGFVLVGTLLPMVSVLNLL
jgi:type II secretory pathway component PulF